MLTNKDYCDYDTCVALKELGIGWENVPEKWAKKYFFIRITLYDAQKWLRERHNLHITIFSQSQESWQYRITNLHQRLEDGLHGEDFSSYEDALNHAIKECIKYVD